MGVPKNIRLFRMVHWQNVAHILTHGLCCSRHEHANPDYINIGHSQLISDRHDYSIPIAGYGSLGEYIPFYFAGHSPMLYLIMEGYGGVVQRPQKNIVYIVVSFKAVKAHELTYVFTDRNAKIAIARYYNHEKDLDKIHWEVVKSKNWANTEQDFERKDLKQAEFLIRNHVPVSCIEALVVKTVEKKQYFEKMMHNLALDIKVHVDNNRNLYY